MDSHQPHHDDEVDDDDDHDDDHDDHDHDDDDHDDHDHDDGDDDVFTKGRPGWDVVVGPGAGVVETGSGGGLVSSPVSLRSAHPCILYKQVLQGLLSIY